MKKISTSKFDILSETFLGNSILFDDINLAISGYTLVWSDNASMYFKDYVVYTSRYFRVYVL